MKSALLSTILLLSITSHAFAQGGQIFMPPNSSYKNEDLARQQEQQARENAEKGFLRPGVLDLSLVSYDYFEPEQFGILINMPDFVSGCYKYSPLVYNASFVDNNYMEVAVQHYKREKIVTRNPNKDCPGGTQAVSALVIINKDDIMDRGINEIRFSNGTAIDRYSVLYHQDRTELVPMSKVAFKPKGLQGYAKDRLIHYKTQEGIVALHVPMIAPDDDIGDAINAHAKEMGLTAIDHSEQFQSTAKTFFFKDASGAALSSLGDQDFIEFGEISVKRAYEGSEGLSETNMPLRVFATKPGTTL